MLLCLKSQSAPAYLLIKTGCAWQFEQRLAVLRVKQNRRKADISNTLERLTIYDDEL